MSALWLGLFPLENPGASRGRVRRTPIPAHTAQKQPHTLGAARRALCAVCHVTRVKVRTSAKSPCLALEDRVRRHNLVAHRSWSTFRSPSEGTAYARRRLVQSRNAVTNLRYEGAGPHARDSCARRLPRAEMRELQELPQPDRRGQPDGRQIVLIHLIPRDQLAALQFR